MTFFFKYLIDRKRKLRNPGNCIRKRRESLEFSVGERHFLDFNSEKDEDEAEEGFVREIEQRKTLEEEEIELYPCLILELPTCILADVLSRLSFKSVCLCRCVCKTWLFVTDSPDFDSLRLERADSEVFIFSDTAIYVRRDLHLLDLQRISASVPTHDWLGRRTIDIEKRVYLPKREDRDDGLHSSDRNAYFTKREYDIVNSCNGFLCLRKGSSIQCRKNPCIVCNPFTGEFITIPKPEKKESLRNWAIVSGFGCSSKSNEFKVVRLVYRSSAFNPFDRMTEVHTLGTDSWRTVGNAPWDTILDSSTTFLSGAIHWVSAGNDSVQYSILSFDFETEQFKTLSLPSHLREESNGGASRSQPSIGVLKGCLVVSRVSYLNRTDIWVMKDYGNAESWTRMVSFNVMACTVCRPIKWLENGDLVMLWDRMLLVLYNPVDKRVRLFKIQDANSVMFEAIACVPTFASLKNNVAGNNLVVHNSKLRWTEAELRQDAGTVSLVEENNHELGWAMNVW